MHNFHPNYKLKGSINGYQSKHTLPANTRICSADDNPPQLPSDIRPSLQLLLLTPSKTRLLLPQIATAGDLPWWGTWVTLLILIIFPKNIYEDGAFNKQDDMKMFCIAKPFFQLNSIQFNSFSLFGIMLWYMKDNKHSKASRCYIFCTKRSLLKRAFLIKIHL